MKSPSLFLQQIENAKAAVNKLDEAATTLTIIRNAMDALANDREGIKTLSPWQRELFLKAHCHTAAVTEALREAYAALRHIGH